MVIISASGGKNTVFSNNWNTREYLAARLYCRRNVDPIQKGRM